MLSLFLAAAIWFTDPALNVGASQHTFTVDGITLTTSTEEGYLQVTQSSGMGINARSGWSATEIEFPEQLQLTWDAPISIEAVWFGSLQLPAPTVGDGWSPGPEFAVLEVGAEFPRFTVGLDTHGVVARSVNSACTTSAGVTSLGMGSTGILHAVSLLGILWSPCWPIIVTPPFEPPMRDEPPVTPVEPLVRVPYRHPILHPMGPRPPFGCCDTIPKPVPVPAPPTALLFMLAGLGWGLTRIRR